MKAGTVADDHAQPQGVIGQLEVQAGDDLDLRVDLNDGDAGVRQLVVDELGQRPGAEADQQHVARPGRVAQQQAGHHLAGVGQFQGVGALDAHRALDPFGAEMQVAHAGLFADFD
jgi:hypothetical protein